MFASIYRIGPLGRHWCMRFEAKHSYFKRLAKNAYNFINIAKTLAKRHQQLMCYYLNSPGEGHSFLDEAINTGRGQYTSTTFSVQKSKGMVRTVDECNSYVSPGVMWTKKYFRPYATLYFGYSARLTFNSVVLATCNRCQDMQLLVKFFSALASQPP